MDIAACHEDLGCFVYLNDGKGNFGAGIRFDTRKAVPYSMIAAGLNRDGRPEILVGYFNDGISKKGTRRWCSMQLCGNRFKVAAYAARERETR